MGIIVPVLSLAFLFLATMSHAASKPRYVMVGGYAGAWKVPDSSDNTLNQWSEKNRFKVGDFLVWKYDMKVDSVLQVTKEDYEICNTEKPLKQYNDGDTKVELKKSGPYFFISGASGNCCKGEKMVVVVLSERKSDSGGGSSDNDSPKVSPVPEASPTQAPDHAARNAVVGLKVGINGLFWTVVGVGLAMF